MLDVFAVVEMVSYLILINLARLDSQLCRHFLAFFKYKFHRKPGHVILKTTLDFEVKEHCLITKEIL